MENHIVLCPNPYRDRGIALASEAAKRLEQAGFTSIMSPVFVDVPDESNMEPLSKCADGALLIVSFGGDGTFLHVARQLMDRDIPMLGVNMGAKGFMAGLEPEELPLVVNAARGEYRSSVRMLLDVDLLRENVDGDGESDIYMDCALNDAVIKSDVSCIGVEVTADGDRISTFSGDGVILSTPTGSTAYSMSAGGPIVEPEAENIIVTPICAQVMAAKSFVLSPERTLLVRPERLRGRRAILSVDGGEGIELQSGDEIRIRRSQNRITMADMGVRSFYETTFHKLTHSIGDEVRG